MKTATEVEPAADDPTASQVNAIIALRRIRLGPEPGCPHGGEPGHCVILDGHTCVVAGVACEGCQIPVRSLYRAELLKHG